MLKEYVVEATVIVRVMAQSKDDAADEAWDDLVDMGLTPKRIDDVGVG